MTSHELRKTFLKYFEGKEHRIVPSSPLIPENDPTLLFTTAGMVQFKPYYARTVEPPYSKASTIQKCLRAGGKNSDLENVGKTPRHHTFFEMLGNFSFGDYFKKEAIEFAYEFVINTVKIPQDKLWISVYEDDNEAAALWRDIGGFDKNRIVYTGKEDNWWGPAGDEGACGPCSEIYIDLRDKIEHPSSEFSKPPENEGFLEFWNLVFNQYNQDVDGNLTPLKYTGIDTGMGFERLLMILQDVSSVYETDVFKPIIKKILTLSGLKYEGKNRIPVNVIADHIRAVTFVLSEGVFPSNEGRGYVLRHILRRAIRYGKFIGFDSPFLHHAVDSVVEAMGKTYPEIEKRAEMTKSVIFSEEQAFFKTLNRGLDRLQELVTESEKSDKPFISGDDAFQLYDSLGFPIDFTEQVASDEGIFVDMKRFNQLMKEQRERAKASWKGSSFDVSILQGLKPTEYTGESCSETESEITAIISDGRKIGCLNENSQGIIITEVTPFYGEKGGQTGDTGQIRTKNGIFTVEDTKIQNDIYLHTGYVKSGSISESEQAVLKVNDERKKAIARNHTATHLIHRALRTIVGEHAAQAGSLVGPDRLRFDFTHHQALTLEDINRIEDIVNQEILEDKEVIIKEMNRKEAEKTGAVAIFEEKYGDTVRVVEVPGFSKELCGGTHVQRTGNIGIVKIIGESSISAGTRRIEAITGLNVLNDLRKLYTLTSVFASKLNTDREHLEERFEKTLELLKEKEKEILALKSEKAASSVDVLISQSEKISGHSVLVAEVEMDAKSMPQAADRFKEKAGSGVIVLFAPSKNKVSLTAAVTKDLTGTIKAGDIAKKCAGILGGGGGGRPDMAQAGGKHPEKIPEAMKTAEEMIENALKN